MAGDTIKTSDSQGIKCGSNVVVVSAALFFLVAISPQVSSLWTGREDANEKQSAALGNIVNQEGATQDKMLLTICHDSSETEQTGFRFGGLRYGSYIHNEQTEGRYEAMLVSSQGSILERRSFSLSHDLFNGSIADLTSDPNGSSGASITASATESCTEVSFAKNDFAKKIEVVTRQDQAIKLLSVDLEQALMLPTEAPAQVAVGNPTPDLTPQTLNPCQKEATSSVRTIVPARMDLRLREPEAGEVDLSRGNLEVPITIEVNNKEGKSNYVRARLDDWLRWLESGLVVSDSGTWSTCLQGGSTWRFQPRISDFAYSQKNPQADALILTFSARGLDGSGIEVGPRVAVPVTVYLKPALFAFASSRPVMYVLNEKTPGRRLQLSLGTIRKQGVSKPISIKVLEMTGGVGATVPYTIYPGNDLPVTITIVDQRSLNVTGGGYIVIEGDNGNMKEQTRIRVTPYSQEQSIYLSSFINRGNGKDYFNLSGKAPLTVNFEVTERAAPDCSGYSINFGNGQASEASQFCSSGGILTSDRKQTFTHTYTKPGTYIFRFSGNRSAFGGQHQVSSREIVVK
ncbi:MAG: PKD domain-containing protein [Candidatus Vogelbacteria bacterium]|nr:PKD domain-containing protein [Candidatus Vogelbacteria bacterium]